jgi:hypothetical protein
MPQESEKELLPPLDPTWAVITCTKRQTKQEIAMKVPKIISHHELLYGGVVISKMTGPNGLDKLQTIAKLSNKQKLVPRRNAVECIADDTGTIESRLKRQTQRAEMHQLAHQTRTVTPTGTP